MIRPHRLLHLLNCSSIIGCVLLGAGCSSSKPSADPAAAVMRDQPEEPPVIPVTPAEPAWSVKRVGGDLDSTITGRSGDYRYEPTNSRVDTELPEGYPAPTPPKAIEIKKYPGARRAEVSGTVNPDMGTNLGFWPLFQHIQRNEIAMTSPVEMDYRDWSAGEGQGSEAVERPGAWTMSFLYRTADMGATGADGNVRVVDTEPVTMLAIGMNGPYRVAAVRTGLNRLREWLATQDEWEAVPDAEPRAMYYNDPSVPDQRKWLEVQIPVRRTEDARGGR